MKELNLDLLPLDLQEKWFLLQTLLKTKKNILVACSGGVDSSFLLYAASIALPEKVFAVTINHELMTKKEQAAAFATVKELRTPWQSLSVDLLDIPEVAQNSVDRCYHCKKFLFGTLLDLAKKKGVSAIAEGKNYDDDKAYRPGNRAAEELGIFQPLFEAKLTKQDIRTISKTANISVWARPATPCIATRFPYGTKLTPEKLMQVEKGEEILYKMGFETCRLRHHGDTCRIEVPADELPLLLQKSEELIQPLTELGFVYICADLGGYKSSNMDINLEL